MQKNIKEIQSEIAAFADARKWAETYQVYGILLNMIEEVGEAWNVVKHLEKDERLLRKVITENKEEMEDSIGDIAFLVFKLAHVLGIDVETALNSRLKEFETRFPADFMKKHAFAGNRRAGGIDKKYPTTKPSKK
jgi:NTP pyrophosphatase (non-canonical NTP hydrolase)